jgi:hypothetical protein
MAEGIAALFERDVVQMSRHAHVLARASDWDRVLPELLQRYSTLCGVPDDVERAA